MSLPRFIELDGRRYLWRYLVGCAARRRGRSGSSRACLSGWSETTADALNHCLTLRQE
jgi:hypothetical protein